MRNLCWLLLGFNVGCLVLDLLRGDVGLMLLNGTAVAALIGVLLYEED